MQTYEDVLRNMGREAALKKVVLTMLALGSSIDYIKKITELPKAVIEKLAQSVPPQSSTKIAPTA